MATPVCIVAHDDSLYLPLVLRSFSSAGPATVFVSRRAWNGSDGDWERTVRGAEEAGAEAVVGDWPDESLHRAAALREMRERGHAHVLIPDGDEVVEPGLLAKLLKVAETGLAERVRVAMDTYWKSPRHVVRPREAIMPLLMVDARCVEHRHIREYEGGTEIALGAEHGVLHHLSYAGPDERIVRKISTWGHREEVGREWYRKVWQGWDRDPLMRDLHPTHPRAYGFVERIELPEILEGAPDAYPLYPDPQVPADWPTVSVVIPLYGGEEDIRTCLESLGRCQPLLHEVVVVDDVSPDGAAGVAEGFDFVRLVRNEENRGFAGTCNRGYAETTGDVVVFLNSDTVVPRAGLVRLVESLMSGGAVGAAGPFSNHAGYHQLLHPTYTSLGTLDLFARDFAHRPGRDADVDILVGFCLAVKRRALEEVGLFDERFGRGMFEDNDLCYRLRRAGYRLMLSSRAFVHHEGSRSLARSGKPPALLLRENERIFVEKWRDDLESGFASCLSGQGEVRFRPELHPELVEERIRNRAREADISLCMIVKNEERVLGDCLESVKGVFSQIVVVDTGSTDRTIEIARSHGADLHETEWPQSFSAARNESLKHARGSWIMWMDADDTLPRRTAEALLAAVSGAPSDVVGFIVPVQFVEPNGVYGTRVDHLKVFRNLPGLEFEGRIHEQILPSLARHPGRIERIDAVVLHSGYDTSEEGQAKKRERDWTLLDLDLAERPNHPFVHFNAGMTAHFTGEHQKALRHLRKSIELARPGESHVRKSYVLYGDAKLELGDLEGALESYRHGVEAVGEDPELLFKAARLLGQLGRTAEAKATLQRVREDPSYFASVDRGIFRHKLWHNLAECCLRLGEWGEARDHLRRAVADQPRETASALLLFEAAMAREDLRTAGEALQALKEADAGGELFVRCLTDFAAARGDDPERALWEEARAEPLSVAPRVELARRLLERGEVAAAMPHVEALRGLGAPQGEFYLGVLAAQRGEIEAALEHLRRSLELNPGHETTQRQIEALEKAASPA